MAPPQLIAVALVGKPHGIRGEIKVFPYKPFHDLPWLLMKSYHIRDRLYALKHVKQLHSHVVFALEGMNSLEAARRLRGGVVTVRRKYLPASHRNLRSNDLLDRPVYDNDKENYLGVISAYYDQAGANGLLEITLQEGGTLLIPAEEDSFCMRRSTTPITKDVTGEGRLYLKTPSQYVVNR